jgi:hypothetical protein
MKAEHKKYYSIFAKVRSELLTTVTLPALLGASYAYINDHFSFTLFSLLFIGIIFSELFYQLLYDRSILSPDRKHEYKVLLPGSPVFNPMSLPRKKLPHMLGVSFVGWMIVALFFYFQHGWFAVILLSLILLLCLIQIPKLFSLLFLFHSFLAPIITFTTYFLLSGYPDIVAFMIGLPIFWISAAAALLYRNIYKNESFDKRYFLPIVALLFISIINIIYNLSEGLYHTFALLSIIVMVFPVIKFYKLIKSDEKDTIPALSQIVIINVLVTLILIISVLLQLR